MEGKTLREGKGTCGRPRNAEAGGSQYEARAWAEGRTVSKHGF